MEWKRHEETAVFVLMVAALIAFLLVMFGCASVSPTAQDQGPAGMTEEQASRTVKACLDLMGFEPSDYRTPWNDDDTAALQRYFRAGFGESWQRIPEEVYVPQFSRDCLHAVDAYKAQQPRVRHPKNL